jgi:hypothetical protein
MGAWYTIGLLAGLGVAVGIAAAAVIPRAIATILAGAVVGAVAGILIGDWSDAVSGAIGGAAGGFGAEPIFAGALRRGGTRSGLAVFAVGGAVAAAAVAFIPVAGYLEAVVLPALALRLRSRAPERYAGLRTLAKD